MGNMTRTPEKQSFLFQMLFLGGFFYRTGLTFFIKA